MGGAIYVPKGYVFYAIIFDKILYYLNTAKDNFMIIYLNAIYTRRPLTTLINNQ